MEFKTMYALAMRDQDPRGFNQLVRSGKMEEFLAAREQEAGRLLKQLLGPAEKGPDGKPTMAAQREAEEHVRAVMLDFPKKPDPAMLEPPEDLMPPPPPPQTPG